MAEPGNQRRRIVIVVVSVLLLGFVAGIVLGVVFRRQIEPIFQASGSFVDTIRNNKTVVLLTTAWFGFLLLMFMILAFVQA